MTNRADPDQTASVIQKQFLLMLYRSSLIRVFPVCYFDKHFGKQISCSHQSLHILE